MEKGEMSGVKEEKKVAVMPKGQEQTRSRSIFKDEVQADRKQSKPLST